MSEDNAMQGWRWAEDDSLGWAQSYVLEAPDGTRWGITKDFAHPDKLLAALQLPPREAELLAEIESLERSEGRESERADYMAKVAFDSLTRAEAAEAREAALVEALISCCVGCKHRMPLDGDSLIGFGHTDGQMRYPCFLSAEAQMLVYGPSGPLALISPHGLIEGSQSNG